jgi:hypothetical protein
MAIRKEAPTASAAPVKGKATAASKAKTTAIVPWTEKFAKYAKQSTEQLKGIGAGGVGVKFGRGSISVGGLPIPSGRLECIVLGSCALNKWYDGDYDPNDAQPPDCYAFAIVTDDEDMAPHADATSPQSEKCADCDKNVYGSARTGRGKACANTLRLGLIVAKDADDAAGISTAEMATAGVSPTNLKNYAGYVKALEEEHGRPPWAVVTEISSHDDPKTQIRVEFKMVSLIQDDEVLEALEKRFLKIQDALQQPYGPKIDRPKPAPRGRAVASNAKFAGSGKKPAGRGK